MNNRTVAHEWANQTRKARNGSNFFFDGPALYSYGTHFKVGLIVEKGHGHKAYLLNARSYSVSTSKHQGFARYAIDGSALRFTVPAMGESRADIAANCEYYLAEIAKAQEALIRTRKYGESCERELARVITEADRYSRYFKAGMKARRAIGLWVAKVETGALVSEADRLKLRARMAVELEKTKKRRAEQEARFAEEREKRAAQLAEWVAGVPEVRAPGWHYGADPLPTLLRIKGAAVETSRGAVVSCRAASVVWAMIKSGRDIVGTVIDGYTVTAFNGELKIGCHVIARAEVERIGALLEARKTEAGEMDSTNV